MTAIRFELPAAGTYDIVVYDLAGRRVRSFHGVGHAGLNLVNWDGRDDRGAIAGSGVYHYRVTTAAGSATRTMVLVK